MKLVFSFWGLLDIAYEKTQIERFTQPRRRFSNVNPSCPSPPRSAPHKVEIVYRGFSCSPSSAACNKGRRTQEILNRTQTVFISEFPVQPLSLIEGSQRGAAQKPRHPVASLAPHRLLIEILSATPTWLGTTKRRGAQHFTSGSTRSSLECDGPPCTHHYHAPQPQDQRNVTRLHPCIPPAPHGTNA